MKLILLIPFILIACDSPCNTPITAVPFNLDIADSSHDAIFSQAYLGIFPLDSVMLYYKTKNGEIHKDSIVINKNSTAGLNVYTVSCSDILDQSVSGIKNFYFRRNFNAIDTIYFDEQIQQGNCHVYKLYSFKYNGANISGNNQSIVVNH